jgi:RepB DNA-primase from phage plasmid
MGAVETIPQRDALLLQLAAIAGNEPGSSYLEIRCLRPDGAPGPREFIPVRDLKRAVEVVLGLQDVNVYVGAAPRVREDGTAGAVERVWCLWADIDGRTALEALAAFRPLPSIVIRSGSPDCAHAYWPLRRAVSPQGAQRANRRLAAALGADMNATDPARILRCAGALNHKHDPPAEVICRRLELITFDLASVVGSLPDSPHYIERPQARRHFETGDSSKVLAGLVRTVGEAQEGNRNAALYWAAMRVREHDDLDADAAIDALRGAALHAGLTEIEAERTVGSAERRAAA